MKLTPLLILAIFIMPIFFSCDKKSTPKELANACIVDSFGIGKDIVKIGMTDFDSLYFDFYEDAVYKEVEGSMNSYRHQLYDEIRSYRFNLKYTGYNGKSMIDYYQECIKDDLVILHKIQQTFKKKFIGYKSIFYLQYQTDFNDSLIIGTLYLTPKKNRIYRCFSHANIELGQVAIIFEKYKHAENPDTLISIEHKMYNEVMPPATVDTTDFIH